MITAIRKGFAWIDSWVTTWRIRRNNPELYAFLCSDESRDPANYVEVRRPGQQDSLQVLPVRAGWRRLSPDYSSGPMGSVTALRPSCFTPGPLPRLAREPGLVRCRAQDN